MFLLGFTCRSKEDVGAHMNVANSEQDLPLWRQVLNWGCVVYFLGLPGLALVLAFTHFSFPPGSNVAKFLTDFHFAVTALVAAVAGLNSFDRYKSNGTKESAPVRRT